MADDEANGAPSEGDASSLYSSASDSSLPPLRAYGHTYHPSGRVLMPNDASEASCQLLTHQLLKLCLRGRLFDAKLPPALLAPGGPGFDVLDVGAGSGLWAVEMAQAYPAARVLGIDLSGALLPKDVPPNLTFEIADAAATPWPDRQYDLIRVCNIVGGGIRDWSTFFSSAYARLRPGGQLEYIQMRPRFFEPDDEANPEQKADPVATTGVAEPRAGDACRRYGAVFAEMCERVDLDWDPVPRMGPWLAELGAEVVRERVDWLPVENWGRDAMTRRKGELLGRIIDYGIENMTLMLFGLGGWKEQDMRKLIEQVKQEVHDPTLRTFANLTFINARKPRAT